MRRLRAALLGGLILLSGAGGPVAAGAPELDPESSRWLALVEPLISDAERSAYLSLTRRYQRAAFERRFWAERDPFPETPANEFADRWRERAPTAIERWGSLSDARALVWAAAGEPATIVPIACPDRLAAAQIWTYRDLGRLRGSFTLVFVSTGLGDRAPHRFWHPREGALALAAPGARPQGGDAERFLHTISESCPRGPEIASRLLGAASWETLAERGALLPRPGDEWVRTFTSLSTDLPPEAAELPASVEYRFAGRRGLRTIVEGAIRITGEIESPTTYHLDGEVLRGGELFEQFRYRFRARPRQQVPFVFERPLRPGTYGVVLRLHDLQTDGFFREERILEVPPVETGMVVVDSQPAPPDDAVAPESAVAEVSGLSGVEPESTASAVEPSLLLRVPGGRLVTGKLRIQATTRGADFARVAFALDGQPVLIKRRPPFGVELDLGRSPRLHRIGAIGYDADGAELARDEVLVNGGPHRFALRLVEPRVIPEDAERVIASAEVDVPEGERLDRVEYYVNDDLHATLFQAPYRQPLPVPRGASIAWIRAVAYLVGGGAAEDVRLVGAEHPGSEIDVDFVELHASVLDRLGRPVGDLRADEVRVYENGEPQELRRMELVSDLPIHAGVLLDTSSSMAEELSDAERAALQFFSEVLTERDRAAVMTFADEPSLAVRFTSSLEVLAGGLAALEPRGDTHLWDAVAYALHYFSGIRGKRALVLITDGQDSGSKYRFDDVLEYARRTGVAFYVIGLNVPSRPSEGGVYIDRLARETGGRSFRIGRAIELNRVYRDIRAELRSQYLIAYQSAATQSEGFREIEVELDRPGLDVRTVRGYYP